MTPQERFDKAINHVKGSGLLTAPLYMTQVRNAIHIAAFGEKEDKSKKTIQMKLVKEELRNILDGAGWATEQYIIHFSDLNDLQKYFLMMELWKIKLLFNEGRCDLDSEDKPGPDALMMINEIRAYKPKP